MRNEKKQEAKKVQAEINKNAMAKVKNIKIENKEMQKEINKEIKREGKSEQKELRDENKRR